MRFFKITKDQAQEIVDNKDGLTQRELAEKYGVSVGHVCNIQNGKRIFTNIPKKITPNYRITDTEEPPVYNFNNNGLFDLSEWAKAMSY